MVRRARFAKTRNHSQLAGGCQRDDGGVWVETGRDILSGIGLPMHVSRNVAMSILAFSV